jgi:hypothetical protein
LADADELLEESQIGMALYQVLERREKLTSDELPRRPRFSATSVGP